MTTAIDLRDYLDLEKLLADKLQQASQDTLEQAWEAFDKAMAAEDWDTATNLAENLSLHTVGRDVQSYAKGLYRATIEFGASLASGGATQTSSLALQGPVDAVANQLQMYMQYGASRFLQNTLLQSIALAKSKTVQKAEALRDFVSFKDRSNRLMQMVSGLHTSRLSGWGFTAEADFLNLTVYKLSAQLDNRTSDFCRFIHGKTFTVDSARPLLNAVVYVDDPEALKSLHPWPDQSKAGLDLIRNLSPQELQDKGYGVPPFHPYCRTLMVKTEYKTRLHAPVDRVQIIPEAVTDAAAFDLLGISMKPPSLEVWNSYMAVNPQMVLSLLTGKSPIELIGTSAELLRVTPKGDISFSWGEVIKPMLRYIPGSGELILSKNVTARDLLSGGLLSKVTTLGTSIGADSIAFYVAPGNALTTLMAGFLPIQAEWGIVQQAINRNVKAFLAAGGKLTATQQQTLVTVGMSAFSSAFGQLKTLPKSILKEVLAKVEYRALYSLDATGLS